MGVCRVTGKSLQNDGSAGMLPGMLPVDVVRGGATVTTAVHTGGRIGRHKTAANMRDPALFMARRTATEPVKLHMHTSLSLLAAPLLLLLHQPSLKLAAMLSTRAMVGGARCRGWVMAFGGCLQRLRNNMVCRTMGCLTGPCNHGSVAGGCGMSQPQGLWPAFVRCAGHILALVPAVSLQSGVLCKGERGSC